MYGVSIKGVLCNPNHEVVLLLNERVEWELPGGRIEVGESSSECLTREMREELGVEVTVGKLIDSYLFEVIPNRHVFIATYRCTLVGAFSPRLSAEHRRIGCFAPTELPMNLASGYRNSVVRALGEP